MAPTHMGDDSNTPKRTADDQMIVMCVCHFDSTNAVGGLEKQARLLSETLIARGQDVVVISSTQDFRARGWHIQPGLRTRLFWTYASPQISGRYLPAAIIWAVQLLIWCIRHRRKISVFHSHQLRIHAFVGALLNKYFGIFHIAKSATGGNGADIRTIGTRKYFGPYGRRFVIHNTTQFIATTRTIKQDLEAYGVPLEKIALIPNGLVPVKVQRSATGPHRQRRYVFLGRLDADKNVLALIHAAARLPVGGFCLDIFGKGELEPQVTSAISGHEWIRYQGFVEDPTVLLHNYGYFVLPSLAEGLSNAMLEAMSAGVVPLTTKVSGCVDHIEPGKNGFLIAGYDEASILAALQNSLDVSRKEWLMLSQNASSYADDTFSIDTVARAYERLYGQIASVPT
jgi:glycosyltransferase involved in cell wall biosynthesis